MIDLNPWGEGAQKILVPDCQKMTRASLLKSLRIPPARHKIGRK